MKTCSTCNIEKEDALFRKDRNQCKECASAVNKKWHEENKEKDKTQRKFRYENDKDRILSVNKKWHDDNVDEVKKYKREWAKEKYDNDPAFRMRHVISTSINSQLKSIGYSKNNVSCIEYLPIIDDIISNIEWHFGQPGNEWMNWDNQGRYNSKIWDDNDPATWTWQLDHIIPHSEFYYETMDCEEFRNCWAPTNLRPLSAKQNVIDGSTRSRHIK